ncbi:hypothetical protein HK097_003269, partial [Rhizophlyctis rosea]
MVPRPPPGRDYRDPDYPRPYPNGPPPREYEQYDAGRRSSVASHSGREGWDPEHPRYGPPYRHPDSMIEKDHRNGYSRDPSATPSMHERERSYNVGEYPHDAADHRRHSISRERESSGLEGDHRYSMSREPSESPTGRFPAPPPRDVRDPAYPPYYDDK